MFHINNPSTMENPQLLASTESFSYGWLINTQPPFRKNSKEYEDMNFNFDFPVITSPTHFVHADEIFSNGQIKAAYDDVLMSQVKKKKKAFPTNSVPSSPIPLQYSASGRRRYYVLEKWRKSSNRILRTCFGFVCKAFRSKSNSRVDDIQRKVLEASRQASPSPTHCSSSVVEYWSSVDYYNKLDSNFDAENSIREAILYCKRSIEK